VYDKWSLVITGLLIYTATVTPYRIALIDEDEIEWFILDLIIDGLFFIDVMVNCFLAYYDDEMNVIVNRRQVFIHYLKG
jgi:hypothetical protein